MERSSIRQSVQGAMRVAHVVTNLDNPGAGTSYTVLRLAAGLAEQEVVGDVLSVLPIHDDLAARAKVVGFPRLPVVRRLGISPAMWRALGTIDVDVLHNHGLWMMPNVYAGAIARRRRIPLVLSPRGMLSEWAMARSRGRKQVVWWGLGQRRAVAAAACFHATSESEAEDIRRLRLRQPIAIVPNGIDLPESGTADARGDGRGRRRVLFLSRIHPKKGIPILLHAWQGVGHEHPEWELVVAGPDERGHLAEVRALAKDLRLDHVAFPGLVLGDAKEALYRSAELFVLPTHSENFGMVIAEALAHGVPVVTTTGAPWRELERRGCGWWIELSESDLAQALREAMALPAARLAGMGQRGRLWMEEAYGWGRIAREMRSVYQWLLEGGSSPPCVATD